MSLLAMIELALSDHKIPYQVIGTTDIGIGNSQHIKVIVPNAHIKESIEIIKLLTGN
jgi:hypothetical protein